MKRFKIFAETLKTLGGGEDGKRRLHGIASSTVKDRHGDVITLEALQKMERQAHGMTIFANHDYTVPESVMGRVEKAELRQHPSDPDIYDLVYDIVMNESNPRAIKSWEAQQEGSQLGLSIGARIPENGATRDAEGAFTITDIELLETSIVGVPASPRSWVDYAVKSLRQEMVEKATAIGATPVDVEDGDEDTPDDGLEKATAMELVVEDEPAVDVVTEDPTPEGQDEPPVDEEAEPESEPVEMPVFNSDEPDTPQDAPEPESQPENGDELLQSEDAEITVKALLSSADTLEASHAVIESLNRELGDTKKALETAEQERDQVVALSQKTMDTTSTLLERLAAAPAGRKTSPVVTETAHELDSLKSVYTAGVMALLTKER